MIQAGSICVNAKKVYDICREFQGNDIRIRSTEQHWVHITSGASEMRLPLVEVGLYPQTELEQLSESLTLSAQDLKQCIDMTLFASQTNESRKNLMGVNLSSKEGNLTRWLATDGHRLAQVLKGVESASFESVSDVIIPRKALGEIRKALELFGEEKDNGSITYGSLEKASGGTLLIDEISEIPLETQSKILRVLIDQKFKRINSNHDIKVNVRIICTSSKNINNETQLGNFREDLFHRLNVFQISIEPLSSRVSDIPLLIEYFSKTISKAYNLKDLNIDKLDSYLINHHWPGNVRELRNLIERIAILSNNDQNKIKTIIKESIKQGGLETVKENNLSVPLKEAREIFEKEYLTTQLKKFGGNISKV